MSTRAPIVSRMQSAARAAASIEEERRATLDDESSAWLRDLRAGGVVHDDAVERLHALLLRAARFETGRRRASHPHLRGDLDEIAQEAADDALLAVLARLDDYHGWSRFTTWAYKFALYQASVKVRRRSWQGREIPVEDEAWSVLASAGSPRKTRRSGASCSARSATASGGAHPAPAERPGRARAQRRPDRRARGAAADDPRRALQVLARRPPRASADTSRNRVMRPAGTPRRCHDGTQRRRGAPGRPCPRAGRPEVRCESASRCSTATSTRGRAPAGRRAARHAGASRGLPACREEHESLLALVSSDEG